MPTYEYRCSAGHAFEQFQRMSEEPVRECPTCGAPAERLLSAGGGLLFKGSGFYITDYRNDAYRKAAAADSSGAGAATPDGAGGSGSGDAGKSDSGKAVPNKPTSDKGGAGKGGAASSGSG